MENIFVTRPSMPSYEEYCEEIRGLWDSKWLSNRGEKFQALQNALGHFLGTESVELAVNGHMALELSLAAQNLEGEVITTPFTFSSSVHAIVRSGLTPVFCDVDPVTLTLDAKKLVKLVSKHTCAVMPVHVYGNICDIDEIGAIAGRHDLKVIYDAAHAFGEQWNGKGIGAFGDATCFSFHATKPFNSAEGGAACIRHQEVRHRFGMLLNFGIRDAEHTDYAGVNGKMNELSAAMGLCNLRHFEDEVKKRERVDQRYRDNLRGLPGISLRPLQPEVRQNYAYFPVLIDAERFGTTRDDLFEFLEKHHILCRKYFYPLVSEYSCYQDRFGAPEQTPVAMAASRGVLTLPMYADLPLETVDFICELLWTVGRR